MKGNCREMEVGGTQLIIYDHDAPPDSDASSSAPVGASLWDCAIVLAHYLPSVPLAGKSVVELGAGTGLPGLTAAKLGSSRVVLTDLPELIPGLRRNVEANELVDGVEVRPLRWGDEGDCSALGPPFDVVLMSDLLYNVSAAPGLCQSIRALSDAQTLILLSYELRAGTTECFQVLRRAGFRWRKIGSEDLHPVWQSEDIGIFRLFRDD
ncbi:uncharacterized protein LOC116258685 [Nymphaea colorata]|nr:uncharacterized protein LOC116258685 [Nymphaea colorata]